MHVSINIILFIFIIDEKNWYNSKFDAKIVKFFILMAKRIINVVETGIYRLNITILPIFYIFLSFNTLNLKRNGQSFIQSFRI